jgi:simple sugar transport system permease protein
MRLKWKVDGGHFHDQAELGFLYVHQLPGELPFRDVTRWSGTTLPFWILQRSLIWSKARSALRYCFCLVAAAIIYWILNYTNQGYRWKMIGLNPRFAQYGGVNVGKDQMKAMVLRISFGAGRRGAGVRFQLPFLEAIAGPLWLGWGFDRHACEKHPIAIVAVSFVFQHL